MTTMIPVAEFRSGKGQFLKKIKISTRGDRFYMECDQRLAGYPFQIEITAEMQEFFSNYVCNIKLP